MLNEVIIMGRLTDTPELKSLQNGAMTTSFTVACDRDFKAKDGTRGVDFIPCVAWQKTAEFVARNFAKGQSIIVSGRLQVRTWATADGVKRNVTEISADHCWFTGERMPSESNAMEVHAKIGDTYSAPMKGDPFKDMGDDDDDLAWACKLPWEDDE